MGRADDFVNDSLWCCWNSSHDFCYSKLSMIEFDFTNLWHLGGAVIWGVVVMFLLGITQWNLPENGWKIIVEILIMTTMLVTMQSHFITAMVIGSY